jgi:hypothetical protein
MTARRCINDFSAPSSANIRTGPKRNIRDGSFELKLALINMVQQSPFCGKALKDTNAHLQHFLEIYSTFTIRGVAQDAVHLCVFPFSLLGKAKQWFYSNKEAVSTWEKCSNAFLTTLFLLGKTNALQNKISGFQQLTMRPSLRRGNICRVISLHAPIMAWRSGSSSKASILG